MESQSERFDVEDVVQSPDLQAEALPLAAKVFSEVYKRTGVPEEDARQAVADMFAADVSPLVLHERVRLASSFVGGGSTGVLDPKRVEAFLNAPPQPRGPKA